ncbi:MAG: single-stranded DNA-binding protein [Armatimonadota bacterium]
MINNVVLVGRLANDPEMKYTQSGMPITTFRLAVDRGRKNDQGESETDWLNIVAFQKTAELVAQYCDKGSLVGIEGRIQSRTWEGQDGKKNYSVEIVANNVRFLESRSEAERRRASRGQSAPAGAASAPPPPADNYGPIRDNEDPFGDQ